MNSDIIPLYLWRSDVEKLAKLNIDFATPELKIIINAANIALKENPDGN
jgi:hypothetical protein